jgi:hypothetical protein
MTKRNGFTGAVLCLLLAVGVSGAQQVTDASGVDDYVQALANHLNDIYRNAQSLNRLAAKKADMRSDLATDYAEEIAEDLELIVLDVEVIRTYASDTKKMAMQKHGTVFREHIVTLTAAYESVVAEMLQSTPDHNRIKSGTQTIMESSRAALSVQRKVASLLAVLLPEDGDTYVLSGDNYWLLDDGTLVKEVWTVLIEAPEQHFQNARKYLLYEDNADAAVEIRLAAAYFILESARAQGKAQSSLMTAAETLKLLAGRVEDGSASLKELENAVVYAYASVVENRVQKVANLSSHGKNETAGQELLATVSVLERALVWAYHDEAPKKDLYALVKTAAQTGQKMTGGVAYKYKELDDKLLRPIRKENLALLERSVMSAK